MLWRKWIEEQGIKKVADMLGVSYETVRNWVKNGQTPKDALKKRLVIIANGAFGYSAFYE